ncbi:helix-turn-helix domain-containing protein [Sphingopyxis flava]|uniref:Transposase n=1 Tax=Sphingopyxis flava TaxID=1507287 RepID=A0A1T5G4M5_9SPHN|nr:helix-turn-helix domain-containing protein [Sphingopyxis flava]SKC03378.1 Transposase [Sphingopyxis flava]
MEPVPLRELTADESAAVEKLAHSRTETVRRVERARVIWAVHQGEPLLALAARLGVSAETVRRQVLRFNAEGLASFNDRPRSGRPPTYTADEVATVIATALTNPKSLELPFASWTLDRLAAYLHAHKGIAMKRSHIDEILAAEGLRWRRHETWFGARVDSEFAEKRSHAGGRQPVLVS